MTDTLTDAERRRFHRANLFDAKIRLLQGDTGYTTTVLDCSITGARVKRQPDWDFPLGTRLDLHWPLSPDNQDAISMQTEVAWISNQSLGLRCLHIDIDSIAHLRRLLELNLGDADLLERDLEQLLAD